MPVTLSYEVLGGGQSSPPTLQYFLNGKIVTTTLSIAPTTYYMDSKTIWIASSLLPNSNSTQRWALSGISNETVARQTLVLVYYRQTYVTFGFTFAGNGQDFLYYANLINYTQFGRLTPASLGDSVWADYMSTYAYGNVSSHQPDTRWLGVGTSGLIEGSPDVDPLFAEQYTLNFTFSSIGPDRLLSTTLTGSYGGTETNRTLGASGGTFWLDYNSSFSLQPIIYPSSGSYRWFLHSISSSNADAPANVTAQYIEQYPLSVSYSLVGGVAPSPPVLTGTSNGQALSVQLFSGSPRTWLDAGTSYSISNSLLGSTSDERWFTEANTTGVANGQTIADLEYFHQVQVVLSYSVVGGGSIPPSNASFVSFGTPMSLPIGSSPESVWADFGTAVSVKGVFAGGSSSERWELGSSASVQLNKPEVLSLIYYHQFLVPETYAVSGGGNPQPPLLTGSQLGVRTSSSLASGSSIWLDSESSWSLPDLLQSNISGERWTATGVTRGTVGAETALTITYENEFLVTIGANPEAGGVLSQGNWFPAGQSLPISESTNVGWKFVGWSGSGAGSYSGQDQNYSLMVLSPIQETANFYVGVTIGVSGRGSVAVSFGSFSYTTGGQLTLFVPPGTDITLVSKPGILQTLDRWQGIPVGNAGAVVFAPRAPLDVNAIFVVNQVEALGLVALYCGVAIFAIAYLVWNRHGSPNHLKRSVMASG